MLFGSPLQAVRYVDGGKDISVFLPPAHIETQVIK
jgi:hypothetical protein